MSSRNSGWIHGTLRGFVKCTLVLTVIQGIVRNVRGVNDYLDLVYSGEELEALRKVKQHKDVMSSLTDDYMNSDFYLIRFLREGNLDVDDSLDMIQETMNWRREHNISDILQEDWSDMLSEFPVDFGSRDNNHRPVIQAVAAHWNVRQGVYYGDYSRLERYTAYILERAFSEVLKARNEGHLNVTRVIGLLDAGGGDASKHFCLYCVSLATGWLSTYSTHYPRIVNQAIFTNTSSLISVAWNILSPFISSEMQSVILSFAGSDNDNCIAYLDERIPVDGRIPEFGGTKDPYLISGKGVTSNCSKIETRTITSMGLAGVALEYLIVVLIGLIVIGICACLVRATCCRKWNFMYEQCRQEEGVRQKVSNGTIP